jgi:putative membrane protein
MAVSDLPALNAIFNSISACFLLLGYLQIRRGNIRQHRRMMLFALAFSALFLTSYLVYHMRIGSVPYPHHDWTRNVYFAILIPHVVLAALNAPFVLAVVWLALRGKFRIHRRLARWVWPVWMFVCVSGVIIYLMLYGL